MKLIISVLVLFSSINSLKEYSDAHFLILKDSESSIDGIELIEEPIFGVSYKTGVVRIIEEGTYIVTGELKGKIHIKTGDKVVKIVLNGVFIDSSINAIVFEDGYEMIKSNLEDNPFIIRQFDFNNAGAQIIIADDSINTFSGTEDGPRNGVIFSNITLHITGEEKGNGKLYIRSLKEGIEAYKHICISGGYINVGAQDDGINTKYSNDSIIYIKGGKIIVNGGLGSEGDGIDGNGYIIIDGGEINSAARPVTSSGLDSNGGTFINGGIIYSVGASLDLADEESNQTTMNLIWEENVKANDSVSIREKNGNEIIKYNTSEVEFINGTLKREYFGAIVSHPNFKSGNIYHIYMNGEQLGYTSNKKVSPFSGPFLNLDQSKEPKNGNQIIKEEENNDIKIDFALGEGATTFSGIQKYDPSKNMGFYLKNLNMFISFISFMIFSI